MGVPDLPNTDRRSVFPWIDHPQSLGRHFLHDEVVASVGHDGYRENSLTVDLHMPPDVESFDTRNPLE